VPLLLSSASYYGSFHGIGVVITSEGTQGYPQTWLCAVATTGLPQLTLESSVLETSFQSERDCPGVIIDESLIFQSASYDVPGASTFGNTEFRPSPETRANRKNARGLAS